MFVRQTNIRGQVSPSLFLMWSVHKSYFKWALYSLKKSPMENLVLQRVDISNPNTMADLRMADKFFLQMHCLME